MDLGKENEGGITGNSKKCKELSDLLRREENEYGEVNSFIVHALCTPY